MIWTIVWLSMAIITRITERSSKFEAHYKGHLIEPSFSFGWIDFGYWMATKMNETFVKAQKSLFSTQKHGIFADLINDSRDLLQNESEFGIFMFFLFSPFSYFAIWFNFIGNFIFPPFYQSALGSQCHRK